MVEGGGIAGNVYLVWHRSSLYPGRLARLTECHLAKSVGRLAGDGEGRIVVG